MSFYVYYWYVVVSAVKESSNLYSDSYTFGSGNFWYILEKSLTSQEYRTRGLRSSALLYSTRLRTAIAKNEAGTTRISVPA